MASRSIDFVDNEYYHIYNRGVDKRDIFLDRKDIFRFLRCLQVLNSEELTGSLFEYSFQEKHQLGRPASKLVEIVCVCLNPNHYHLLVKQVSENGISKFMHRLGTAYSKYFNEKYKRSGALFQGRFKAKHVDDNNYLLHLSAYINLNFEAHDKWKNKKNPMTFSSWPEYCGKSSSRLCSKSIILKQFPNRESYKKFAKDSLKFIKETKEEEGELAGYLLE